MELTRGQKILILHLLHKELESPSREYQIWHLHAIKHKIDEELDDNYRHDIEQKYNRNLRKIKVGEKFLHKSEHSEKALAALSSGLWAWGSRFESQRVFKTRKVKGGYTAKRIK